MRKIAIGEPLETRGEDIIVHTVFSIGKDALRKLKNLLDNFQKMESYSMGWYHGR
jgi:hypothetical protein